MSDKPEKNEALTESSVERQNILNNPFALQKVEESLALGSVQYQGETIFTKQDVARLLDIDERTIERYLNSHKEELSKNGYQLLQGKSLKELKEFVGSDIDVGTKTTILGIFSFRAVLNLAMLLTESEKAKMIRARILDIVIDILTQRAGGKTKYINQRDADYLPAAFQEENHRNDFTSAISRFLDMPSWKYDYKPLLNDARTKMASRDKCFRDALHHKLEHYIQSVPETDFERFLGEKSKELEERILETREVFERLKDK